MSKKGFVTVVGVGPGDIGLLTLAGLNAIRLADVVLYDRKVTGEIQAFLRPGVETVELAEIKERNEGNYQELISDLVVKFAKKGKKVARLKAGDTNVFGREDKEFDKLIANGIPYRIIPGITSALAAPVYAGVPITHRDCTDSIHIITAMSKDGGYPKLAYRELAALNGTLVFLMATSVLAEICGGLMDAGMAPDMPVVMVENGTLPQQRRLISTLSELPGKAKEQGIHSPAVLTVGSVCGLAQKYDWTGNLPLWGRKILSICSRMTPDELPEKLRAAGCGVDEYVGGLPRPIRQGRKLLEELRYYTWIVFTSAAGADVFFQEMERHRLDIRTLAGINLAAIGMGSAQVLNDMGIIPEYIRDRFDMDIISRDVNKYIQIGDKVLLYGACDKDEELTGLLRRFGVICDEVAAYDPAVEDAMGGGFRERVEAGEYDAVTFTRVASVPSFVNLVGDIDFSRVRAVCLDKYVAAKAAGFGMRAEAAPKADIDAMVDHIVDAVGGEAK